MRLVCTRFVWETSLFSESKISGHFIEDQLDELYSEFSQCFNLAEFPDVEEQLLPSEVAIFRTEAGAPADVDFSSVENYDCFLGLRAVIRHRLAQSRWTRSS